jgi:NADH-quinone oxidoreductase subunit J
VSAVFYISGAVALLASLLVVTRRNAAHAALYLIVSLLAIALAFFALGAPLAAALEVIVYAGAIMVLFVFVIVILGVDRAAIQQENAWLRPRAWAGPVTLAAVLALELLWVLVRGGAVTAGARVIEPKAVARALFGPYMVAVELASFLLLAALVGVFHLGGRAGGEAESAGATNAGAAEETANLAGPGGAGGEA